MLITDSRAMWIRKGLWWHNQFCLSGAVRTVLGVNLMSEMPRGHKEAWVSSSALWHLLQRLCAPALVGIVFSYFAWSLEPKQKPQLSQGSVRAHWKKSKPDSQGTKSIRQDELYPVIYCYFLYHTLNTTIPVPHLNGFWSPFIKQQLCPLLLNWTT